MGALKQEWGFLKAPWDEKSGHAPSQAANAIFFRFCAAAESKACSRIPAIPRIRAYR